MKMSSERIRLLAEELVVSLTGMGGKLNSHENNVNWTAALIDVRVGRDVNSLTAIITAAKFAISSLLGAEAVLADIPGKLPNAIDCSKAADALAAAIRAAEGGAT